MMARSLPLLAAAAFLGCLASAPQSATDGNSPADVAPTEFRPPWRSGGEIAWAQPNGQLANGTVPEGWQWASDGATFLYATSDAGKHDDAAVAKCGGLPNATGAWVLVNATACSFARHPTVACDTLPGEEQPCGAAWRMAPNGTNVFHPYWHVGAGAFAWTRWNGERVNVTMPEGASWATDGHSYLYATRSHASHDGPVAQACLADHAGWGPVVVLVEVEHCGIAAHPGISCGGWKREEDPCEPVTGPGPGPVEPTR